VKEKVKPILTTMLLAFAGVTLLVQIAKEFRPVQHIRLADGLNVISTHGTQRCTACTAMERLARETLEESFREAVTSGRIVFRGVDYERREAAVFADEFRVATAAVVLVNVRDGKTVTGKNLANETWQLYADEPAFKKMLREQIDAMLQGRMLDAVKDSQEIIFDLNSDDIALPF
jgi:hypothetical protein